MSRIEGFYRAMTQAVQAIVGLQERGVYKKNPKLMQDHTIEAFENYGIDIIQFLPEKAQEIIQNYRDQQKM